MTTILEQHCASFSTEPTQTKRSRQRHRKVPYTIIQGDHEKTVKARSALKALRRIDLIPGAIVTVFIPQIVQGKRLISPYISPYKAKK